MIILSHCEYYFDYPIPLTNFLTYYFQRYSRLLIHCCLRQGMKIVARQKQDNSCDCQTKARLERTRKLSLAI